MLLIHDIRADKEGIIARLAKRGKDFTDLVNRALTLDDKRKSTQVELDTILAESNKISKEIINSKFGQTHQKSCKGQLSRCHSHGVWLVRNRPKPTKF